MPFIYDPDADNGKGAYVQVKNGNSVLPHAINTKINQQIFFLSKFLPKPKNYKKREYAHWKSPVKKKP